MVCARPPPCSRGSAIASADPGTPGGSSAGLGWGPAAIRAPRCSRLYEMFGSGGAICILSLAPVSSEEGESSLRDQLSFEINYLKKKNRKRERDARCQIIIITLMIKKNGGKKKKNTCTLKPQSRQFNNGRSRRL